jgi:23S rRNA pseudouridine1911/1915/1917 synthase
MSDANQQKTLLDWLTRQFPRGKRQNFKRMLSDRRILINGRPAERLDRAVGESDVVRVLPRGTQGTRGTERQTLPSLHPLKLVHEDDDILIIDKPAGLLTSTVAREKRPTALAIVRRYVAARSPHAPVGLIHRLDRDASGLLIFSKAHRAYQSLKTQFFKHTVERVYHALVEGKPNPPRGRIESYLIERADGTVRSTPERAPKSQRAITDYDTIKATRDSTSLKITLLTGRKHQIRAQLSQKGHPVIGDETYGSTRPGPLQLRAVKLAIEHPVTAQRMAFEITPL